MMKHISLKASAAALAASMALIAVAPALAQQTPQLFEGQEAYRDRDRDDNRDDNRDRNRKPDFQWAQEQCSRAGINEAWRRGYYSAQYHDPAPRLERGRYGWEMRGKMRLHNRRGYSYVNTACDVRGNRVEMEFLR